jgi:hypothetical protein
MFIHRRSYRERPQLPPTEYGWGWKRTAVRTVVSAYHASQGHQLPLSTCHVRSGPWTAWSVTGPDRTVASRPWRLACRQSRAGTPATPPCRANQAAAATGVGWPPRSDTRDSANADRSRRPAWRWPRWPGPPGRLRGERCLIRTPKRPAGRPVSSRRIRLGATSCLSDARARRQAPVSGLPDSPVHRSWQGPDLTAVSTSPLSPPDDAIRIWLICL